VDGVDEAQGRSADRSVELREETPETSRSPETSRCRLGDIDNLISAISMTRQGSKVRVLYGPRLRPMRRR